MIARLNKMRVQPRSGWTALLMAAVIYTVVMAGYTAWRAERSTDFRDFWRTAQHFRDTGEITGEQGVHNYLPFFVVFMVPWTLLPLGVAIAAFTIFSMALLAATVWMIESLFRRGVGPSPSLATLVTIGLMLPFIHSSTTVGAVNVLVLFLVVASWFLFERGREWEAGLPLGLAVLIKLLPAVLIVFFLLKLRWRVGLSAIILAVALGVAAPLSTTGFGRTVEYHQAFYRGAVVEHSARATITSEKPIKAKYSNQSMPIVLRRLFSPIDANAGAVEDRFFVNVASLSGRTIWVIYLVIMLSVLTIAAIALGRGSPVWPPRSLGDVDAMRVQFGLWCCLMLIASPLVWTHYFALAFWPLAVAAHRSESVRLATGRACRVSIGVLLTWLIADILIAWPAARAAGVHMLAVLALFGSMFWYLTERRSHNAKRAA